MVNPSGPDCADKKDELAQVVAFHKFSSAEWANPSASATFVTFHNLVTASVVNITNLMGSTRNYHCAKAILLELPRAYVADVAPVQWAPQPGVSVKDLPGLEAQNKFIVCPP